MREIVRVYVRGRIDARLSVCILHLAHDWNWIHLEGREVLSLTDSYFQIVKNHKQTVHVGSCSYNSAMLRGDKGCRKPSGFHTRSRKHHWLRPLIPSALYTAPHELILILYCVLQWNSKHTWRHTGMSRGCPSMLKLFFFFDFSLVFSSLLPWPWVWDCDWKTFTFCHSKWGYSPSLQVVFHSTARFRKQMSSSLKDRVHASTHGEISHQQNKLDARRLEGKK